MKKVLITGGNGLIGKSITEILLKQGISVNILSRKPKNNNEFYWDYLTNSIDIQCFKDVDTIIHLAGENIGNKRWTAQQKQIFIDSRVKSAHLIFNIIKQHNIVIQQFITASGIGYYGDTKNQLVDENATNGNDFLAEICKQWENAALQFKTLNIKVSILRLGLVLNKNGGVLPKLLTSIQMHIGTVFGNGNQYLSWIHINDAAQIFVFVLQNQIEGVFNVCTPNSITYKQLNHAIAKQIKKKIINLPIPKTILQLTLGQMSEMLLTSNKCNANKIIQLGYAFQYDSIDKCLANLLN